MDKSKYLYWLDPKNPELSDEIIWREMYSRIGYIFHIIQMIEYNMANIISIEEFEKLNNRIFTENDVKSLKESINLKFQKLSLLTFGGLKNKVLNSIYLNDIDLNKLQEIKEYRDYLAHQCFKEKVLHNKLSLLDNIDKFIDELNTFEEKVSEMNEYLLNVFKNNKTKTILMYKTFEA